MDETSGETTGSRARGGGDWRVLGRLLGYLRPYPVPMTGALAAVTVNSILQLAPPYLTKVVIDRHISLHRAEGISHVVRLYLITLVAAALLESAQTYILQLTAQRVMFDLRLQVYRHLQKLDVAFYDRNPLGRLMTRVTTDVEVLNDLFTSGVHAIFFDLFTLAGIVVVLLGLNWRLALVTFAVVPLVAWLTRWFRRNVRESFRQVRSWVARINAYLQEHITGIATVQLFRREAQNAERFREINAGHRDANLQAVFYYAIFYPAIEIVATVATASILWYGGAGVMHGSITLGSLVAFLLYAQRFFRPVADISEKLNSLQAAMAASERVFGLLDTPVAVASPATPVARPARRGAPRIVFDRVSFGYREGEDVLRQVSFDVAPGERVGIVGATGSGKSTLISLLLRFYDVRRGRILVDGVDIRQLDLAVLRGLFGLVLQDVQLFAGRWRQRAARQRRDRRRRGEARGDGGPRRHVRGPAARRACDAGRRARSRRSRSGQKQLLSFARALAFDPAGAGPRRGDRVDRHRDRAPDPGRARRGDGGPHHPRNRPPALDDAGHGQDPRHAQGRAARGGDAPAAAAQEGAGLPALAAAAPRRGGGARGGQGARGVGRGIRQTAYGIRPAACGIRPARHR